ncbi:hypothetical protein P872_10170 [Rhodonellum psychrophilum GCM71 = DSM 17998]|uniref:Uncharacterized protein n=1 Tax=Rhodonellum psychrophilum GCM71 = DSM 17998 TaxID=1123057 RepID=U5BXX3_9BACT|nr:hypothetical protein P872_10170 [Rhodonellum psychrophilum GCM71 = DSM 17998]
MIYPEQKNVCKLKYQKCSRFSKSKYFFQKWEMEDKIGI